MADTNGTSNGSGVDFARLSQDLYNQWESAVTSWWDTVLDSPDVLGASGDALRSAARARKQYEQSVDQGLDRMHLPTKTDLVRLTRIATLLEERLLQLEDRLLGMQDKLVALERETVQARVDAAQARLEQRDGVSALQEQLATLQARLDAIEQPAAPTRRRRRSTKSTDGDKA